MPKHLITLNAKFKFESEIDTDDLEGFEGDEAESSEVAEFVEAQLEQVSSFDEISDITGTIKFTDITSDAKLVKDEEEE